MRAKIIVKQHFEIEIDGKPVNGSYRIVGDWEGMVKLSCDGPVGALIIHSPDKPKNSYDLIPKMLGGNAINGAEITFEAEVVRADCGHVGIALTKEFKDPRFSKPAAKTNP
jgi:hypothetical protein